MDAAARCECCHHWLFCLLWCLRLCWRRDPKMPWHRQASVLARFGEGDVNLLLATSVCEEGMDIQVRPKRLCPSHAAHVRRPPPALQLYRSLRSLPASHLDNPVEGSRPRSWQPLPALLRERCVCARSFFLDRLSLQLICRQCRREAQARTDFALRRGHVRPLRPIHWRRRRRGRRRARLLRGCERALHLLYRAINGRDDHAALGTESPPTLVSRVHCCRLTHADGSFALQRPLVAARMPSASVNHNTPSMTSA